ncbi:MAG: copper transport protein [Actinomycetota bacterium]|nr:copper transport protein [Actinomycetota bacterium]
MGGRGGFGRRWARACAVAAVTVAALALGAGPASAHAVLVNADPGSATVAPTSPAQVQLHFSEPVDVSADSVDVLDPDGAPVATSGARPAASPGSTGNAVVVPLPAALRPGTYIVRWHLISRDGHPTVGEYRFAVRTPSSPLAAASQGGAGPSPQAATGRALSAGGGLALVGLAVFPLLVLRPTRRRLPASVAAVVAAESSRRLRIPTYVAAAAAVGGTLVVLADNAATRSGRTPLAELLHPVRVLSATAGTRTGNLLLLRLAAIGAAALLVVLIHRRHEQRRSTRLPAIGAGAAAGVLVLTFALSSHAATEAESRLAVSLDSLHLLAAGVWAGGLLALALAGLPAARQAQLSPDASAQAVGALAGRFSVVAQAAMVTLLGTGAYAALIKVTAWSDLSSAWGRDLVVKLALWVTVLLVAAGNAFFVVPALADRARDRAERRAAAGQLASSVRLELGLAAGLIVAAGVLSATAPPAQTAPVLTANAPAVTTARGGQSGYAVDVQAVRSGKGAAVSTVFGVSLTTEGTAASAPSASATLTGRDGIARAFELDLVDQGQWSSPRLAVSPGSYRMTVQVDRATGAVRIPVTVRVG